jgi:predicted DCC family thiol-disulfide oxidoreductase YuxK
MLYDGMCVLCNGAARFALTHEQEPRLKFAPLQSQPGRALAAHFGLPTDDFKTFLVVRDGHLLGGRWAAWARVVDAIVPDVIGNAVYRVIAPIRRVFGAEDRCIVPTPEQRLRQLDGAEIIPA